jgi:hypothetical protein
MYIAIALLACLDSPPTNAHSTFQHPRGSVNYLAALKVVKEIVETEERIEHFSVRQREISDLALE